MKGFGTNNREARSICPKLSALHIIRPRNLQERNPEDDVEDLQPGPGVNAIQWTRDRTVDTLVEGLVQGDCGKTGGPYAETRINEEVSGETGETVTDKVGTKSP